MKQQIAKPCGYFLNDSQTNGRATLGILDINVHTTLQQQSIVCCNGCSSYTMRKSITSDNKNYMKSSRTSTQFRLHNTKEKSLEPLQTSRSIKPQSQLFSIRGQEQTQTLFQALSLLRKLKIPIYVYSNQPLSYSFKSPTTDLIERLKNGGKNLINAKNGLKSKS
jgi:hypothetical protein